MNRMVAPALSLTVLLAAAPSVAGRDAAAAASGRTSPVEAVQAWSRPATAGATGVGYMVLVNHGTAPVVLVHVQSPLARRVEIHRSTLAGGVMSMAAQTRVEVPAGAQVMFSPGGYHLMFVALARPLSPGGRLPAVLRFADGRRLRVEFAVGDGGGPPNGRGS